MSIQQREQFKQLMARVAELEKQVELLKSQRKPGPKPQAVHVAAAAN